MPRHPLTAAQRDWLTAALADWQAEDLISADQSARILDRYEDGGERSGERVVTTLTTLAAVLFGLAVLLVVGFNWDAFTREAKLGVVLATVGITHGIGLFLRDCKPALATTVQFLACLFYGAGIWLIAQAYHLDAQYQSKMSPGEHRECGYIR